MLSDNKKSYLALHFIVFIWGFTAVLGALLTLEPNVIVWYRMLLAAVFLAFYIKYKKLNFKIDSVLLLKLTFVGLLIALHWILFFQAIKVSNVSITLAVFSLGSFFAALLEPLFFGRKIVWYELGFGLIMIIGLGLIAQVEMNYLDGMLYALVSIFLGVLFTILNGKLIQEENATVITFYEFLSGSFFITIYFLFEHKFTASFFEMSSQNAILLFLLASVCTAFAFTASVGVMKQLSPFTVMLTVNLEPVYGITLAYLILGEREKMQPSFYIGALLIIVLVVLNALLKRKKRLDKL